jgi:hypothetical protein
MLQEIIQLEVTKKTSAGLTSTSKPYRLTEIALELGEGAFSERHGVRSGL